MAGRRFTVVSPGSRNALSGPDFLNARLQFEETLWAGHIELHVRASDWYAHGHERDPNFANVVLHVVWEYDADIFNTEQNPIPTFCIRDYIQPSLLHGYRENFERQGYTFLRCAGALEGIDKAVCSRWVTRMYLEKQEDLLNRLKSRSLRVNHHWEHLLFLGLFKRFGGNINGTVFLESAERIPFRVIQRIAENRMQLESLFMGMTGLLGAYRGGDPYFHLLRKEFRFLRYKFKLPGPLSGPPEFYKLRPSNFPTIRLAQLASIYHQHTLLFPKVVLFKNPEDFYGAIKVGVSPYWKTHYVFGKPTRKRSKIISRRFADLVLVNEIIPLRNYYMRSTTGRADINTELAKGVKPEKNSITRQFEVAGIRNENGVHSQGLLYLHKNYCLKNRCLHCAIGHYVLKGK